jgi:hypothetical protein
MPTDAVPPACWRDAPPCEGRYVIENGRHMMLLDTRWNKPVVINPKARWYGPIPDDDRDAGGGSCSCGPTAP